MSRRISETPGTKGSLCHDEMDRGHASPQRLRAQRGPVTLAPVSSITRHPRPIDHTAPRGQNRGPGEERGEGREPG